VSNILRALLLALVVAIFINTEDSKDRRHREGHKTKRKNGRFKISEKKNDFPIR